MRTQLLGFVLVLAFSFGFSSTFQAQENEKQPIVFTDAGVDLVSGYIWRGIAFNNSPNIQAAGYLGFNNFLIGAWGSVSFNGQYFEPNLWIMYNFVNTSITITDVDAGAGFDFFNYKSGETAHILDASLAHTISDNFPLKITASVIFYGFDKKIESYDALGNPVLGTKDNYSGYVELNYPISIGENTIELTTGFATQESLIYATKDFSMINAGVKFSKDLKINEQFSLPISFAFIANPDAKQVFTVLKISL